MSQQFAVGTPVYNATGNRIGSVSNRGVQGGYLVVQKGRIFHQNVYVPLDAIRRSDERGIYLRLYKPYVKEPGEEPQREAYPYIAFNDEMTHATTAGTTTGAMTWPSAALFANGNDDIHVPLREEQLTVEKQQREMGRVRIHKYIVEEPQTIMLAVTHDEVHIERVPVKGHVAPGPDVFSEKHVEMLLMGEDVVVDKRTQIVEEVHLYKSQITEGRAVSEVVRKERMHIEGLDDSNGQIQFSNPSQ